MWPFPFVSSQSASVSLVRDRVLQLGWGRTLFIMDGALGEICVYLIGCTSLSLPLSFFFSLTWFPLHLKTVLKHFALLLGYANNNNIAWCVLIPSHERVCCESIGCFVDMTFSSPYPNICSSCKRYSECTIVIPEPVSIAFSSHRSEFQFLHFLCSLGC